METQADASRLIERPGPLSWLRQWAGRDVIKVVTGVRRCGKSTLLNMFQADLAASGVEPRAIVSLNLEDPDHADLLGDYRLLYNHIKGRLRPDGPTYVFVDEIQNADQFERVVDGLFILKGVDLYLTGSNSQLLAGPLARLLTGRYVELRLLPLSFSEFAARLGGGSPKAADPLRDWYDTYTRTGGFPFAASLEDLGQVRQYLEGVLDTVLMRDAAGLAGAPDPLRLRAVTEFVFSSIGSLASPRRIADAMTSAGRAISRTTIERCLAALAAAFLTYPAARWDVRGKRLLESGQKHYVVDTGLRRALLGDRPADRGHVLENLVYLELLRRGGKVMVGKIGAGEVDFVVEDSSGSTFIQVAAEADAPGVLERELAPLRAAPGYQPRLLLTLDREPPQSYDGIRRLSALEWLAGLA
ncbi:MAG: ATP-binding protein [Bifidobacteriaceae bacterium]|jgi:predicted AAA+ superfamily ATPase|nr:ATP-binding protein [Bifidobacteriaceae bacterium]